MSATEGPTRGWLNAHADDGAVQAGGLASDLGMLKRGPRVIVTGGRDYTGNPMHMADIFRVLAPSVVVHGACPTGADALADFVAKSQAIPREPHPADWSKGLGGGPRRNQEMADAGADLCLAFPGNNGTADMVRRAKLKGIPVIYCDQDDTMELVRAFAGRGAAQPEGK